MPRYVTGAQTWASVTPVLLPGFDDRKQHHGDHLKRLARAEQLLCKAFDQAGMRPPAHMQLSHVPLWQGGLHARDYQPREKLSHYPRYHVRVVLEHPCFGPLALEAGRQTGFGLLAACHD